MKNANGFDVSTKNVMLDMWMNWLCLNIIAGVTAKLGKIHTTHNTVVESAGSAVVFSWFSPADDANILLTISVDENNHITWDIRQHDGEGDNLAKAEQGDTVMLLWGDCTEPTKDQVANVYSRIGAVAGEEFCQIIHDFEKKFEVGLEEQAARFGTTRAVQDVEMRDWLSKQV